ICILKHDLEAIDTNIDHVEPEHKDLLRVHEVGGGSTIAGKKLSQWVRIQTGLQQVCM
ncbi:hypothetical protein ACJX0J_024479, partial [Zea mays]